MEKRQINPNLRKLAELTYNPSLKLPNLEEQLESPTILTPNIKNNSDYWRIEGVSYRGKLWDVDLAKTLLDDGNEKTQDEWAQYSKNALSIGSFYVGDMPLYHSVFGALFSQKGKQESEEARAFIQKSMRERYPMTLTRIFYKPKEKDTIIHNYNTADRYSINEDIVGKDRAIIAKDSNALTALLGEGDINKIKAIYNWINETDTWIWRLNEKPKSVDERVAWFIADSDRAYLNCNWDPDSSNSSLGVRVVREAQQKNK